MQLGGNLPAGFREYYFCVVYVFVRYLSAQAMGASEALVVITSDVDDGR